VWTRLQLGVSFGTRRGGVVGPLSCSSTHTLYAGMWGILSCGMRGKGALDPGATACTSTPSALLARGLRLASCMEYSRALTRRERDPRQVPSSLFVLSHARSAGVGVGVHSRGSGGASRRCGRGRTTLGCQRRRWASCRVQRHRCDPPTPLCPFQLYCERRLGYIKLHRSGQ
jgi:hypothetical protein